MEPLVDPATDVSGHDPRSEYVETFWLAALGPSTTWMLRYLAGKLDAEPNGAKVDLVEMASRLGLGPRLGRSSPLLRSIQRAEQFGMARTVGHGRLAVRRRLPDLSRRQVEQLPPALRTRHAELSRRNRPPVEKPTARVRRMALSLVQLGEDRPSTEAQLRAWGFSEELSADAVEWALDHCRGGNGTAHGLRP
ncbi:MAG: hypothetical protein M0Z87_09275 [Actinomycetota bacterium]|nr:hypothetical protein [Actinomycetota bacterium]